MNPHKDKLRIELLKGCDQISFQFDDHMYFFQINGTKTLRQVIDDFNDCVKALKKGKKK